MYTYNSSTCCPWLLLRAVHERHFELMFAFVLINLNVLLRYNHRTVNYNIEKQRWLSRYYSTKGTSCSARSVISVEVLARHRIVRITQHNILRLCSVPNRPLSFGVADLVALSLNHNNMYTSASLLFVLDLVDSLFRPSWFK